MWMMGLVGGSLGLVGGFLSKFYDRLQARGEMAYMVVGLAKIYCPAAPSANSNSGSSSPRALSGRIARLPPLSLPSFLSLPHISTRSPQL